LRSTFSAQGDSEDCFFLMVGAGVVTTLVTGLDSSLTTLTVVPAGACRGGATRSYRPSVILAWSSTSWTVVPVVMVVVFFLSTMMTTLRAGGALDRGASATATLPRGAGLSPPPQPAADRASGTVRNAQNAAVRGERRT
jgi:hypothetical protein